MRGHQCLDSDAALWLHSAGLGRFPPSVHGSPSPFQRICFTGGDWDLRALLPFKVSISSMWTTRMPVSSRSRFQIMPEKCRWRCCIARRGDCDIASAYKSRTAVRQAATRHANVRGYRCARIRRAPAVIRSAGLCRSVRAVSGSCRISRRLEFEAAVRGRARDSHQPSIHCVLVQAR